MKISYLFDENVENFEVILRSLKFTDALEKFVETLLNVRTTLK